MLSRSVLKQMSRDQLTGQWGSKALMSLVYFIVFTVIASVLSALFGENGNLTFGPAGMEVTETETTTPGGIIFNFVVCVLTMPMSFGFTESFMRTRIGENPDIGILFSNYKNFKKTALYGVVMGGISAIVSAFGMVAIFFPFIGSVIVLFATIFELWLSIRLSMAKYILIENPYTNVMTALRQSFFLTSGYSFKIFVLYLSFIGWAILSVFTLLIGFLWLAPYYEMTLVNFYYDLKQLKSAE